MDGHKVVSVYFCSPVVCSHCGDYIWGSGEVGVQCSSCKQCFHDECQVFCSKSECLPLKAAVATFSSPKPLSVWTPETVKEWLAVVNLYRYMEQLGNFTAEEIFFLDKERLEELRISDPFVQQSILNTIDELQQRNEKKYLSFEEKNAFFDNFQQHEFVIGSFYDIELCIRCSKPLLGIVHQGCQCKACGIIVHRQCARLGVPRCETRANRRIRNDFLERTNENQIPLAISQSVKAIEQRGVAEGADLYDVYRFSAKTEDMNKLKEYFERCSPNEIDLSSFDLRTIAGVLKAALKESEDSLLPAAMYADFIDATENVRMSQRVRDLLAAIPATRMATLQLVMAHLVRVWRHQAEARNVSGEPRQLYPVFSHALLRPPWNGICKLVYNGAKHLSLIRCLLLDCDWNERRPQIASAPSGGVSAFGDAALKNVDWYFGNISKEDASFILSGLADGAYLVRDSSTFQEMGDYTLSIRFGGTNKLIKISKFDGGYGFHSGHLFHSVVDLVEFYREHSLEHYQETLKTKLLFPMSRHSHALLPEAQLQQESVSDVFNLLLVINKRYMERMKEYDAWVEERHRLTREIQHSMTAVEAFKETILMLNEHRLLNAEMAKRVQKEEDRLFMTRNLDDIQKRINDCTAKEDEIKTALSESNKRIREYEAKMLLQRPEIASLLRQRQVWFRWLVNNGISEQEIVQSLDDNAPVPAASAAADYIMRSELPRTFSESDWLRQSLQREDAVAILRDLPDGAYLVRGSDKYAYVLSISLRGDVHHCPIHRTDRGVTLAAPLVFGSLVELIQHYSHESLGKHNKALDTTLSRPAFAKD